MNERKLNQLFASARREAASPPPADFDAQVMRAIRREPGSGALERGSLLDQLESLFPRLAWGAALVLALCLAAESGAELLGWPNLTEGVAQLSDQWLLTANAL